MNYPEYLRAIDVAFMLNIQPKEVRDKCSSRELKCERLLGDKGRLVIETKQFIESGEYYNFLKQEEERKQRTLEFIKLIQEYDS